MFFEQYGHEPFIAVSRHWIQHLRMTAAPQALLPEKQEGGCAALSVMEAHLRESEWFGGDTMSIAEIALFAYTHVADEGGFDLARCPAVGAWLDRVRDEPGHIPMEPARENVIEPRRS